MTSRLSLRRPDDWHLHLRDGAPMAAVVNHSAACFGRALIMPNLNPPIATVAQALQYRARIVAACGARAFEPLMALYLTPSTSVDEVRRAADEAAIAGFKLYPARATTNSEFGVTDIEQVYPVLEAMAKAELPLMVHGESTNPELDVFDREAHFIEHTLTKLVERLPALRVVLEHVTTEQAVQFIETTRAGVAATITAHHLLYNRNALFEGGLRPDAYCLPVLKREHHRQALLRAATSGSPRFFLGTDSAPHPQRSKYSACGCAGTYTAHAALGLYAEAFESVGALNRLEDFASRFGAEFYRRPLNAGRVYLKRQSWRVPDAYPFGDDCLTPLRAGQQVHWELEATQG